MALVLLCFSMFINLFVVVCSVLALLGFLCVCSFFVCVSVFDCLVVVCSIVLVVGFCLFLVFVCFVVLFFPLLRLFVRFCSSWYYLFVFVLFCCVCWGVY